MTYFLLLLGFVILLAAGDILVRGATALAARHGLPPLLIALTIVALGTSLPEMLVSIKAALDGAAGLALGNIVGSNIANIWLVLGLPALVYPIACQGRSIPMNALIMMGISFLLVLLCLFGSLGKWDGVILIGLLAIYLLFSGWDARSHRRNGGAALVDRVHHIVTGVKEVETDIEETIEAVTHTELSTAKTSRRLIWGMIAIGVIGLPIGANLIVNSGTEIASYFGVSDAAIGLSLVAVGTSLPELATALIAAIRRNDDMVVGNVVGSNIMNILAILGVTALISPLPVEREFLYYYLWIMILAGASIFPMVMTRGRVTRLAGVLFILLYAGYLGLTIEVGSVQALPLMYMPETGATVLQ